MIFAGVSAVVVLALIIAGAVFVISIVTAPPRTDSSVPYAVHARPTPAVDSLDKLFPAVLGPFKRTVLGGSPQNFNAVYSYNGGPESLTISGSQSVSYFAAIASVNRVMETYGQGNSTQRILDSDPSYSYYLRSVPNSTIFAWSHTLWFFSVQAKNKATLDEFMKIFKY